MDIQDTWNGTEEVDKSQDFYLDGVEKVWNVAGSNWARSNYFGWTWFHGADEKIDTNETALNSWMWISKYDSPKGIWIYDYENGTEGVSGWVFHTKPFNRLENPGNLVSDIPNLTAPTDGPVIDKQALLCGLIKNVLFSKGNTVNIDEVISDYTKEAEHLFDQGREEEAADINALVTDLEEIKVLDSEVLRITDLITSEDYSGTQSGLDTFKETLEASGIHGDTTLYWDKISQYETFVSETQTTINIWPTIAPEVYENLYSSESPEYWFILPEDIDTMTKTELITWINNSITDTETLLLDADYRKYTLDSIDIAIKRTWWRWDFRSS